MKRLEGQISSLSQQITSLAKEKGYCDEIELRNCTVHSVPSMNKQEKNYETK